MNIDCLTSTEKRVLYYVARGLNNHEIAKIMIVTHHTIKAHIGSILRKLGQKNRINLAVIATLNGLITEKDLEIHDLYERHKY